MDTFHSSSAAQLHIDGVSVYFGGQRVLADVSFAVGAADRVGLIGENGSGKSTLLRVAAGLLAPDAGTASVTGSRNGTATIGLLQQEPPFALTQTISEVIEQATAPARAAASAVDHCAQALADAPDDPAAAEGYAAALATAERLDAWGQETRIASTLAGLGLADVARERRTGQLSGGQRARLSLVWLLLWAPEVLLLDEPTNHLDDAGAEYLNRVLLNWRGPVLFASHDRAFLDENATALVDLDPAPMPHRTASALAEDGAGAMGARARRFNGGYSDYLAARADARARWERQYRDEQAELKRLRAGVRENQQVGHADWTPRTEGRAAQKYYADRNAKVVARRVNDSRSRLEKLAARQIRKPAAEVRFAGLTAAGQPAEQTSVGPLLSASAIAVTGRLSPLSLQVSQGEKLLLTGPNGSGKSTLLKLLAGRLKPTTGTLQSRPGLRVGLLSQETGGAGLCRPGLTQTVRQAYAAAVGAERAAQTPLSTFGLLSGRDEQRLTTVLSLGQRRRLELAILLADPPELLLLDEPSNHFSLPLVSALESAVAEYPGAVIVASHDRWLRRRWQGSRLRLSGAGD